MRAIVAYDVSTPDPAGQKRLKRVAKLMERYGVRVQKSVFECLVNDTKLEKMLGEVEGLLRLTQDSVIVYLIGDCCTHKTVRLGIAPPDRLNPEGFVI